MKTFKNWSKELALVTNFTGEKVNPTEYQQGDRAAGTTAGTTRTMKIAHSIPLAGHMGQYKTAMRFLMIMRFHWPTLFKDVAGYCRTCPECQCANSRRHQRVPLVPLPIMGESFQRKAMDVVGPLPKSRRGNRFIMVLCDYATRFPEAIPMSSVDELVNLFSKFGIPTEILSDQGANFMPRLLKVLYDLMHIHRIHTYQMDFVEWFNKTLKGLLRKFVKGEGKDWDLMLPYLLFTYREVPQESTGSSTGSVSQTQTTLDTAVKPCYCSKSRAKEISERILLMSAMDSKT